MNRAHVRIDYIESVAGKKQLLSAQINLLEIMKRVRNYRDLRKRELILKNKGKNSLSILKTEITHALELMPHEHISLGRIKEKREKSESREDMKRRSNIESQLDEIKSRLQRLG